jgi:hypothetical protein
MRALGVRARTLASGCGNRLARLGRVVVPYSWAASLIQGAAFLGCEVIYFLGPPPGVSVACLAMAAVVVTFRVSAKSFGRLEQVVWILLSAAFLYIEIASITTDRAEETARFQAVIDQGRALNEKQEEEQMEQRQKFAALIKQGGDSIKDLGVVANKVSEGVSFASGGDTFPEIFPYEVRTDDGRQRVGFAMSKRGKYPLFDVRLDVGRPYSVSKENDQEADFGTQCKFPEINGNWSFPLMAASMDGESSAYFTATTFARNGRWDEVFDVRRVEGKLVSRWVVFLTTKFSGPGSKVVSDLADQGFPLEHRHDALQPFPNHALPIPDISQRGKMVPDVIFGAKECTGFW